MRRPLRVPCLLLIVLLALGLAAAQPVLAAPAAQEAPALLCRQGVPCPFPMPHYFAATGFGIDQDAFWNYFQRRGGLPTFGYPVSRTIRLLGFPTQFFQRQVMQLWPDGSVHVLNLLDASIMPYTTFNSSTFPLSDAQLVAQAPSPADPNYGALALSFVRTYTPNVWNGLPVGFGRSYFGTVTPMAAFPEQAASSPQVQALLPLVQLEVWGLPTSLPAYDPANHGFVYLRLQRRIMMFDVACNCTQGVLFGDYLKSIITGRNLPTDLSVEAAGSPYLAQYAPGSPRSLARPDQLPQTDLTDAFTPTPLPMMAMQECGSLTVAGATRLPVDSSTARTAEQCFTSAIATCGPATLRVTWMGVDAGVTRTFTMGGTSGGCTITVVAQPYMVPRRPGANPPITSTCSAVTPAADGLHFTGCGDDGDLVVPAPS